MSSSENSDPFADISELISKRLCEAGWQHGKSRCNWRGYPLSLRLGGWPTFASAFSTPSIQRRLVQRCPKFDLVRHPAIQILDQLLGICLRAGIDIAYPHTIIFEPDVQSSLQYGIRLSEILDEWLIPIGEVRSLAGVWAGDMGTIYISGFITPGVYLAGYSFGEALAHLSKDDDLPLVNIDRDDDLEGDFVCPLESYPDLRKRITLSEIIKNRKGCVE